MRAGLVIVGRAVLVAFLSGLTAGAAYGGALVARAYVDVSRTSSDTRSRLVADYAVHDRVELPPLSVSVIAAARAEAAVQAAHAGGSFSGVAPEGVASVSGTDDDSWRVFPRPQAPTPQPQRATPPPAVAAERPTPESHVDLDPPAAIAPSSEAGGGSTGGGAGGGEVGAGGGPATDRGGGGPPSDAGGGSDGNGGGPPADHGGGNGGNGGGASADPGGGNGGGQPADPGGGGNGGGQPADPGGGGNGGGQPADPGGGNGNGNGNGHG